MRMFLAVSSYARAGLDVENRRAEPMRVSLRDPSHRMWGEVVIDSPDDRATAERMDPAIMAAKISFCISSVRIDQELMGYGLPTQEARLFRTHCCSCTVC